MEWKEYSQDQNIEAGYYWVQHERYFRYPIFSLHDGKYFTLGPQVYHLPSTIPISVTHYLRVPEIDDKSKEKS